MNAFLLKYGKKANLLLLMVILISSLMFSQSPILNPYNLLLGASTCASHSYYSCYSNDVYWFNSCNQTEEKKQECGPNSYSAWSSLFCMNNSVYKSRTCYNRGCSNNSCFSNSQVQYFKVSNCAVNSTSNWSTPYCKNNDQYVNRSVFEKGCSNASCYINERNEVKLYRDCGPNSCSNWGGSYCKNGKTIQNRTCYNRGCSNNSCFSISKFEEKVVKDCGNTENGTYGSPYCKNDDVYKNRTNLEKGCSNSSCYLNSVLEETKAKECEINSTTDWGSKYCKGSKVYQNRTNYTKGCANSDCFTIEELQENLTADCGNHPCNNGECSLSSPMKDFVYDDNGNMIQDGTYYYEYNGANQLSRVREGASTGRIMEEYKYNPEGRRVKKIQFLENGKNVTTYYPTSDFDVEISEIGETRNTSYFFANGERIAELNSTGSKNLYLSDHLGSSSVLVTEDGVLLDRISYNPFGSLKSGGENSKYNYNSKELDDTGLLYYGARYYNPTLMRWTQPDWIIQDIYDPQGLNRYSYVKNNPLKYTDPSGNFAILDDSIYIAAAIVIVSAVVVTYVVEPIMNDIYEYAFEESAYIDAYVDCSQGLSNEEISKDNSYPSMCGEDAKNDVKNNPETQKQISTMTKITVAGATVIISGGVSGLLSPKTAESAYKIASGLVAIPSIDELSSTSSSDGNSQASSDSNSDSNSQSNSNSNSNQQSQSSSSNIDKSKILEELRIVIRNNCHVYLQENTEDSSSQDKNNNEKK